MSEPRAVQFVRSSPTVENYWRAIILFGRNVASYKFALAASLIDLADQGREAVSLEELAVPFSEHLVEHLERVDTQGTSAHSRFLDACRAFNRGDLDKGDLIDTTARLGFVNVVDAFHVVGPGEIPIRFFADERSAGGGIRLTEDLYRLTERFQYVNLPAEVEARWRLVETSWDLQIPSRALEVAYDTHSGLLVVATDPTQRTNLTGSRDALNGYQKGRCFYCSAPIRIDNTGDGVEPLGHVDHLIPFRLGTESGFGEVNLDGVWNLVLACPACNLSKHDYVPHVRYLEALGARNDYLIGSHHPLRSTLIAQTGASDAERRSYLQAVYRMAELLRIATWEPKHQAAAPIE
jgi:5-methylcytosine-specific restriction endonuclease McrA